MAPEPYTTGIADKLPQPAACDGLGDARMYGKQAYLSKTQASGQEAAVVPRQQSQAGGMTEDTHT
jgi:hypothetical protein